MKFEKRSICRQPRHLEAGSVAIALWIWSAVEIESSNPAGQSRGALESYAVVLKNDYNSLWKML
ncbi:MAG TPA: hypothetical protein V6C84_16145 [Coleofasciculaceae cyanobacterium]|jgi:hypothetical protein